jgi:hypothetical protein
MSLPPSDPSPSQPDDAESAAVEPAAQEIEVPGIGALEAPAAALEPAEALEPAVALEFAQTLEPAEALEPAQPNSAQPLAQPPEVQTSALDRLPYAPVALLPPGLRDAEHADPLPLLAMRRSSARLPAQPKQPVEPAWRDRLRWIASAAALALLLAAALIAGLARRQSDAVTPEAAQLLQAAKYVGEKAQAGDALAFVPAWSSHEPAAFAQTWQAKGLDPKADFLTAEPLDLWQADGYRRLWIVATHDRLARLKLPLNSLDQRDFDQGTAVGLYALPTSTTLLDLRKSLATAVVQVGGPSEWRACTWQADRSRFSCGGPSWQDVWADLQEVGNTRRDCIYLHPPSDKGAVRLTVPSSGAAKVEVRVGNRLWAVRHGEEGTPVRFRVLVGGETRRELNLPTADFAWHALSTELLAADLNKPVTFEAYAAKEAWRELCFEARLVGQTAGGGKP